MKDIYIKGEKIRRYKLNGGGKWSSYDDAITGEELDMFKYACAKRLVTFGNDAPRGGKRGEYIEVLRDFTVSELEATRAAEVKARDEAFAKMLKSELVETFTAISDVGSIKIDGVCYSNFYGDGDNFIEVFKCDFDDFKNAKYLSKREIFNPKEPITIVKFDAPKTIEVALSDVNGDFGVRKIENACGFCIWERKARIFVNE